MKIKRALLSVWNKNGIVELGQFLVQQKIEILSTGGTQKALEKAGMRVTSIGDVTGNSVIMDGRVKTLHPKVFGGDELELLPNIITEYFHDESSKLNFTNVNILDKNLFKRKLRGWR